MEAVGKQLLLWDMGLMGIPWGQATGPRARPALPQPPSVTHLPWNALGQAPPISSPVSALIPILCARAQAPRPSTSPTSATQRHPHEVPVQPALHDLHHEILELPPVVADGHATPHSCWQSRRLVLEGPATVLTWGHETAKYFQSGAAMRDWGDAMFRPLRRIKQLLDAEEALDVLKRAKRGIHRH